MVRVTKPVFTMNSMKRLLKELRRWRYLARDPDAGAALEVTVRVLDLRVDVHLVGLTARSLTALAAVEHVDLPAQVAVRETLSSLKIS